MQIRPRESDLSNEDQDETNEIVAATRAVKQQRDAAGAEPTKAGHWPLAKIGLGIGSAAVVAALLFARNRKKDD